jgi:hypothetical protein
MSTNYYWRRNICAHCDRYDELHVGHFVGGGWSFQGYIPKPFGDESQPLLFSWFLWKAELRKPGQLWSEYGYQRPVEEFIVEIDAVSMANRRRQYDWIKAHPDMIDPKCLDKVDAGCYWLDEQGYSFHGGDFT